jgi:hypothetical protein
VQEEGYLEHSVLTSDATIEGLDRSILSVLGMVRPQRRFVDGEIREPNHGPTVGILLCTERNRQVIEYILAGVVTPIGVTTYELDEEELQKKLPAELEGRLPAPEELRAGLERIVDERGEQFEVALDACTKSF